MWQFYYNHDTKAYCHYKKLPGIEASITHLHYDFYAKSSLNTGTALLIIGVHRIYALHLFLS